MKRILSILVLLVSASLLFAAARPSLDGRAVVASKGEMPTGLFAKTVGYLPGDSVSVTNPTSGMTIEVLILGAIDPSEGIAILLSPEAAEKLGIKRDSNIQVKITKRAGQLDEAVTGTAILAHNDGTLDEIPAETTNENNAVATTKPVADSGYPIEEATDTAADIETDKQQLASTSPIEAAETEEKANEPVSEPVPESESDFGKLSYIVEDEGNQVAAADATTAGKPIEEAPAEVAPAAQETVAPEPAVEETAPAEETPMEPVGEELPPEPETPAAEIAPAETTAPVAETPAVEPAAAETVEPVAEEAPELPAEEKPADAVPEVDQTNPNEPEADLEPQKENASAAPVEPVAEETIEPVAEQAPELPAEEKPAEVAPEETTPAEQVPEPVQQEVAPEQAPVEATVPAPVVEEPAPVEEPYNPIVLVPTESVAPTPAETEAPVPEAVTAEPEVVAPVTPNVVPPAENKVTQPLSNNEVIAKHAVSSVSELNKEKYYIQIASLTKEENMVSLIEKYKKYPIILLPRTNGAGYQVLVGPLSSDEYGTILEKFKAFGFKDAFIKKIK